VPRRSEQRQRIKVLCYVAGDRQTPSSRQRLFELMPLLQERRVDFVVPPLPRSISGRTLLSDLMMARQADVVLIQKRLMLPHYLALLKALRPLVYDFDDALYAAWPRFGRQPTQASVRLSRYRLVETLKRAATVTAGNDELRRFAEQYCQRVRVVPTSIRIYETSKQHRDTPDITIGWTGTDGNLLFLRRMPEVLRRLNERLCGSARLKVVCSRPLGKKIPFVDFKRWSLEDEADDLTSFDIGIMPLRDDDWARGKCGFKLLQYSAAGLPVVASPVGANCQVVREGETGFLAESDDEWISSLETLARDATLRQRMGQSGREHAHYYSPEASADLLAQAIWSVMPNGAGPARS
jgi:glycosyltransferase involved in cell wall biosynthesis